MTWYLFIIQQLILVIIINQHFCTNSKMIVKAIIKFTRKYIKVIIINLKQVLFFSETKYLIMLKFQGIKRKQKKIKFCENIRGRGKGYRQQKTNKYEQRRMKREFDNFPEQEIPSYQYFEQIQHFDLDQPLQQEQYYSYPKQTDQISNLYAPNYRFQGKPKFILPPNQKYIPNDIIQQQLQEYSKESENQSIKKEFVSTSGHFLDLWDSIYTIKISGIPLSISQQDIFRILIPKSYLSVTIKKQRDQKLKQKGYIVEIIFDSKADYYNFISNSRKINPRSKFIYI